MRRFLTVMAIAASFLLLSQAGPIDRVVAQQPPEEGTETVTVRRNGTSVQTTVLKEAPDPDSGRPARAGSIILTFRRNTGNAERDVSRRFAGTLRSEDLSLPDAIRIQVPEQYVARALEFLRSLPWVESAEADLIVKSVGTPNDSYFGSQWGMTKINAAAAWDTTTGSASVRVAVLDCGIFEPGSTNYAASDGQLGHPDLRNNKVVNRMNFTTSSTADDLCNHGTHVAGITAANTNNGVGVAGVGYNVKLINGKVLGDNGSGSSTSIINGILWAANCTTGGTCGSPRAEVINMSLGGAGSCPSSVQSAINIADGNGLVVVAAAGNSNTSASFWPAVCNNVIAVGASALSGGNEVKPSYSNYGSWVDVVAPGSSILSSNYIGGYSYFSGTSMASPHVAGLAALLSGLPDYSDNDDVIDRIYDTANGSVLAGSNSVHGRIDAAAAVGGGGTPAGDFSIGCNPASLSAQQGQSDNTTCTITSLDGFNSPVSFSCSGAPAGVTCSASPLTPPANGSANRTVSVNVGASVTTGMDAFQIVATSGSLTKQANMSLDVSSAPVVTACAAPVITVMNDTNPTGSGTVSFSWDPVSGASQYRVQRQSSSSWSTRTTTSNTSFSGSDSSSDPNWRVYVYSSNGGCTAPSTYTTFDPGPPPDDTAPTVESTSPNNGATGVGTSGTTIRATFSENMSSSSVTSSSNFVVRRGGTTVSGSRSYSSGSQTVTFTPSSALQSNTVYTATLTTGAEDASGNNLESTYEWTFTTGTMPSSSGYHNCASNEAAAGGDDNGYQTNAGSACANGGSYARDTNSGDTTSTSCDHSSKDRHIFYNYGFDLPSGATINGVQVRVDGWINSTSSTSTRRICVEISEDGGDTWSSVQTTPTLSRSSSSNYTLGATSDTWGLSLSPESLSNSNFRVRLTNVASNTSREFRLDWVGGSR